MGGGPLRPHFALLRLLALCAAAAAWSAGAAEAAGAAGRRARSIDLSADLGRPSDARLPEGLVPAHYHLTLQPNLAEGKFKGTVRINATCEQATRAVHLHAHEALNITHDDVRVWELSRAADPRSSEEDADDDQRGAAAAGRTPVAVASTKKDSIQQQYVIFLTRNLTAGENYEIELSFVGALNTENSEAFFMNSYEDHRTKGRRPYAATQMYPQNARRVFPCFDGPHYKATFEVTVVRPSRMAALSNMPLRHSVKMQSEPGWEMDHFYRTPLMSTFSLAVVVSDLGYITPLTPLTSEGGPQIRLFGRAHFLGRLQAAADAAPEALAFLQDFLGKPFPLPGIDLVVLPHFAAPQPADMWGIIIFREEDLVGEAMQMHLVTELAHQWLGHFVTPAPRLGDLQLTKAIVHHIMLSRLQGTLPMLSTASLATRDHSLYYEYSKKHPYAVVKSQKETIRLMKLQWVVRMINNTITERTFKGGLQHFIQDRQLSVFEEEDLWAALSQQGWHDGTLPRQVQLHDAVTSWVRRDRFPAVSVVRNYSDSSAQVQQHVFLRERPRAGVDDGPLWWVPLPLLAQSDLDLGSVRTAGWLRPDDPRLFLRDLPAADSEFIIVNPNEIGMYMVNYDVKNWNMLRDYLKAYAVAGSGEEQLLPAIDVGTRAKLLHDAWNLALAGELPIATALNLTAYLPAESEFTVWDTFFTIVDHVGHQIGGTVAGEHFKKYACKLVNPLFARMEENMGLRMEHRSGDDGSVATPSVATPSVATPGDPRDRSDPVTTLHTMALHMLCTSACEPCRSDATARFRRWMDMDNPDEGNPVADVYLCPVFERGTEEEWEFGLQRVLNFPAEREPEERNMLLAKVAGCAKDESRIIRLLNMSILETDSNFTTSDLRNIANAISGSSYGPYALFTFFAENWDAIKERCAEEPGLWEFIVSRSLSNFKTQEGLDLVSELYVTRMGQFGPAESIVDEALKTIKEEAEWSSDNLPKMEQWLRNHFAT